MVKARLEINGGGGNILTIGIQRLSVWLALGEDYRQCDVLKDGEGKDGVVVVTGIVCSTLGVVGQVPGLGPHYEDHHHLSDQCQTDLQTNRGEGRQTDQRGWRWLRVKVRVGMVTADYSQNEHISHLVTHKLLHNTHKWSQTE